MSLPTPHAALRTSFTEAVGITYPLVQTGMGWVAGPRLVAASAEAGILGLLASATMTVEQLSSALDEVRSRTDRPFGVNMRVDAADVDERLALMIAAGVKVASFVGAPNKAVIDRCHAAGLFVIPTIGARRHAEKVASLGVDALIAQGGEGGGHTGSVPTSLLLPEAVDAVQGASMVLGAGGFYSGRGLVAALAYGAQGVAMGTRFLLTKESTVPDSVKARYLAATVNDTVVSTKIDGAPQRVIRTEVINGIEGRSWIRSLPAALTNAHHFRKETGLTLGAMLNEGRSMKKDNELTWPQVIMAANAPMMTKAALVDGRPEDGILPTGQVTGVIDALPSVAELVTSIIDEANATLERLTR